MADKSIKKHDRLYQYTTFMPNKRYISSAVLEDLGFFTSPASTNFHGAYPGGLFDHSYTVAQELVNLTEKLGLVWGRPESPYIVGMYHDLCKVDLYSIKDSKNPENGTEYDYSKYIIIPGHGDKSVIFAQKYIQLTDEEIACIRWHMGAYETDTKMWEYYGRAVTRYPNVLYTHTADMIAARIRRV